jgi:ABC-2 type transport system permease protein
MTTTLTPRIPLGRYGLEQTTRSEISKVTSLRSSLWILLITLVGTAGITVLAANSTGHHSAQWYQGFDPTNQSLSGLAIAVLAVGVFGVLAVTSEFGSGTIRSSSAPPP